MAEQWSGPNQEQAMQSIQSALGGGSWNALAKKEAAKQTPEEAMAEAMLEGQQAAAQPAPMQAPTPPAPVPQAPAQAPGGSQLMTPELQAELQKADLQMKVKARLAELAAQESASKRPKKSKAPKPETYSATE